MIAQNMVGGWYVDAIVSKLVPFKFDDFSILYYVQNRNFLDVWL